MGGDLSILSMIVQASLVVQIVIGILLAASLMSWAIIFRKSLVVRRAQRDADRFENSFWSGGDLSSLYRAIESRGSATTNTLRCSGRMTDAVLLQSNKPMLASFRRRNSQRA